MDDPGLQRLLQRLGVHMRDHQHGAVLGVDRHAGQQPVGAESRRELRALPLVAQSSRPTASSGGAQQVEEAASARRGRSRNTPANCVVTVEAPGFFTPRIAMQLCSASIITATPRGLSPRSMACAICAVIASWVCSRRAKISTTRASFESPTAPPFG